MLEKLKQYMVSQEHQSVLLASSQRAEKGLLEDKWLSQATWYPSAVPLMCYCLSKQQEHLMDSPTAKERRGDWDNT